MKPTMSLSFTRDQFFEVFAAYNRSLWPFSVALWLYAVVVVVFLARDRQASTRFPAAMLAVQWAWAGLTYHMAFFSSINPAAWLFGALFLMESILLAWTGVVHDHLRFSPTGSARHVMAWVLIVYALLYPMLAQVEGHTFPSGPTFGVPCPTSLLTIGLLMAADPPWPRAIAAIPIAWAFLGGSAAVLLGVRTDLMLWVAGLTLTACALAAARSSVHV